MAIRTHPIYMNFASGEISPKVEGRLDLPRYFNGANRVRDWICLPQGGVETRGGFHFVAETKDSTKESRMIGFEFSELQNYMMEFGDLYIRFFMDRGQIQAVSAATRLLIHCNGDNASQVFTDSGATGHTVTANGNVQVDTTEKVFGSGSALFDGAGDYLSVADHADWDYGAAEFTNDLQIRFNSQPALNSTFGILQQYKDISNYIRLVYKDVGGVKKLEFEVNSGGVQIVDLLVDWEATLDTWYHIAVIRGWNADTDDWALCINGVALTTDLANAGVMPNLAAVDLEIGRMIAANYFDGRADEIRILKGVAMATADFNPPTLEYPLGEGGTPYEITSPYYEVDLPFIRPIQSDENMYLCHPDYWPRKLTRTDHAAWTLAEVDFIDGPYEDERTAVVESSAVSGQTTIALKGDGTHFILYDAQAANFAVDELLTGGTSTATAKIMVDTDWGAEGVLLIAAITGTFQNNENITDSGIGDATSNGTIGDGYMTYDTEAGGPFQVAETLTGGTTGATGTLRGLQDDGATGKLVIEMVSAVNFTVGEEITGGTSSATANVVVFTRAHGALFATDDAGIRFRYYHGTTWTWLEIKSVTDDITAVAIVRGADIGAGPADASKYRKGSWSNANGFPRSACFHEGRLVFAGSYEFPNTMWGSKIGYPEDHTPGTTDEDPYAWTAADLNIIRWIQATRLLSIGALNAEVTAVGPSDGPITIVDPPRIKSETTHGSDEVGILKIGKSILFLQKAGRKLREFVYTYETDAYEAPDLTQLSEHLTGGGIIELAYQQEPDSIIWALRSDGVLLGCTYVPPGIVGWHHHHTDGEFESIATIPYQDVDQLWAIVNRTIDGDTKRYVEYLDPDIHVDCGLTYSGAPITALSGLGHLEGKTIQIVGDGAVYPTEVVASGAVAIEYAASEIYVGIGFTPSLITNRPEVKVAGTSQVSKKRWNKIVARVIDTFGITINGKIPLPARSAEMDMDTAPTPFSGDVDMTNLGWDVAGRITIEQPLPIAASVVCVLGTLVIGDD